LVFERRRRDIAPEAASRYGCLWVAEDSNRGKEHIKDMFPNACILEARISRMFRVTKCDTRWFDGYILTGASDSIDRYWSGTPMIEGKAKWEFLVEGALSFELSEVDRLCLASVNEGSWPKEVPMPDRIKQSASRVSRDNN